MESFDVIVVGAGPAGSAAAYQAAKHGAQVLLLERGPSAGSKAVSGGLLYTHVVTDLFPDFVAESTDPPFERFIGRYTLSLLGKEGATSVDFYDRTHFVPPYNTVSVLRSKMDRWLADRVREAGGVVAEGVRVDSLVRERGEVRGIRAGDDEIHAHVVIVCDGFNSLLLKDSGLREEWNAKDVGLGVKEVIELDQNTIEERFQLEGLSGAEYTFLGHPAGVAGGGFLYTNRSSLSLGVILNLESFVSHGLAAAEVMEDFRSHPFISRLVEGGQVVEYSTCLVAEGGLRMAPRLFGDGLLVAGSAAGFVLNTGFNLRGMDFAIASGRIAGEVAAEAARSGDVSSARLSLYERRLRESFVLRDLERYRRSPHFFEKERLYREYPEFVYRLFHTAYTVDGSDKGHLYDMMKKAMGKEITIARIVRDLLEASRSI
jgi:electron transfer flavoprotein-quinone oxidoreductase